ncbi:hypothetical protein PC122_g18691 [Phytophthora cactorum]|nr:hypothetical protein PC122_g18691 [Phytophthora cactorum]
MMETWSAWKELVGLPMAAASEEMSWIGGAVAGIVVWVISTPLRNVSWVFRDSVSDGGHAVFFFWYTYGDRYLEAARTAQALALPPVDYACALVTLAFLIPIAVHQDYKTRFGITGLFCLKWGEALHHSCCLFVPDAIQLLWVSSCKYGRAIREAVVAVIDRTGDFIVGVYVLASLLLSILIYLPPGVRERGGRTLWLEGRRDDRVDCGRLPGLYDRVMLLECNRIVGQKSGVKFELCRQGSLKPFTPSCESFSIAFSEFKLVCGSWTYSPYSTT